MKWRGIHMLLQSQGLARDP